MAPAHDRDVLLLGVRCWMFSVGLLTAGMIVPDSYCWTNPFIRGGIHHFYGLHFQNLYGDKMFTEMQFLELLMTRKERPEIMLKCSFDSDRAAMVSLCREH